MAETETRPWTWQFFNRNNDAENLARLVKFIPAQDLICQFDWQRRLRESSYGIGACWRCAVAKAMMGCPTMNGFLRDLMRRPDIQDVVLTKRERDRGDAIPSVDAMTAFGKKLLGSLEDGTLRFMAHGMLRALRKRISGLGDDVGIVSVPLMLEPRSMRKVKEGELEPANGFDLTATCKFQNQDFRIVTPYFGFCLHVLLDLRHEVPLEWIVAPATPYLTVPKDALLSNFARRQREWRLGSVADGGPTRIREGGQEYAWMAGMLRSIDAARPVGIDYPPVEPTNVRREEAAVYCYSRCDLADVIVRRRMVLAGTDHAKQGWAVTEKWRCRAATYGTDCAERPRCGFGTYGRVVRVRSERGIGGRPDVCAPAEQVGDVEDLGAAARFRRRVLVDLGFADFRAWDFKRAALRVELGMLVLIGLPGAYIESLDPAMRFHHECAYARQAVLANGYSAGRVLSGGVPSGAR